MLFSVITINYNNASGLKNTIESVICQSFRDFEFIVVDGDSTDGSKDIIKNYADDIDCWVSEPDGGIYPAMNKGTRMANGEYCIYMNSGDTFFDNDVLKEAARSHFTEDIVCGDLALTKEHVVCNPDNVSLKTFYVGTLYHQATFIKSALIKAHPYDENLRLASDWKFLMEMLIFHDCSYRHVALTVALFEGGGASDKNAARSRKEVEETLSKYFPKRVLDDYHDYCLGDSPFRRMTNGVELIPWLKKMIFTLDRTLLKILNIRLKQDWISNL